jgi:hypothetical protein
LWPTLAPLPAFIRLLGVAAMTTGLGTLAGARRIETALVAGWGLAGLATLIAGTLGATDLTPLMLLLGACGLGGLARAIAPALRGAPILHGATARRVLLLGALFLLCAEPMVASGWDDFSHWLPNLAYLCRYRHFPTLAQPAASYHAAYPPGLALPGFAVFLIGREVPETAAIWWNLLLMLAAGACIARVIADGNEPARATLWSAAALGVLFGGLACPSFVPKIALSNMTDSATGSVLAVLVSVLLEWWERPDQRTRLAWVLGLCCVALVNLRQSNFALFLLLLIGTAAALVLFRHWRGWRVLLVALPPPLLAWALWGRYTRAEIPHGAFVILPLARWHWAAFGRTLTSMGRVMLAKGGLFGLILVITARAAFALRPRDPLPAPRRAALFMTVVLCLGNIGFLAFCYLAANFSPEEAAAAASFWRYAGQTGPVAILALAAAFPFGQMRILRSRPAAAALVAVAVLLPVATAPLYRYDRKSPVPVLRRIAQELDRHVPPGQRITLLDLTGDGYSPIVVAYQLWLDGWHGADRPVRVVSAAGGFSAARARGLNLAESEYIWLADGAPEMAALFGAPLSAGCSYLIRNESGRFDIAAAWRLGPYVRPVNHDGWSDRPATTCR